jgi:Tfp pilus assembly protein FimT
MRRRTNMRNIGEPKRAVVGITLLEVVFAIVILAVLARFAMMKLVTPATMTLPVQAQSLADTIRRAQSLAVVRGQRTSVRVGVAGMNGRLDVACAASAPCSTDTSFALNQGAVLGGSTIFFNSLGQPVNSLGAALTSDTSYTLSYASAASAPSVTYTVTVAALTGRVSVSP